MTNFTVDKQYRTLNVGAHRKPAPMVGAPAIILHHGLWRPYRCNEELWHRNVDYFLYLVFMTLWEGKEKDFDENPWKFERKRIYEGAQSKFISPNFLRNRHRLYLFHNYIDIDFKSDKWMHAEGVLRKFDASDRTTRHSVFSVRSLFLGLPIAVRAESSSEFWTITFTCDFDKLPLAARGTGDRADIYGKKIERIYEAVLTNFKRSKAPVGRSDSESIPDIREQLNNDFETFVEDKILKPCLKVFPWPVELHKEIGTLFAKFFGNAFGLARKSKVIRSGSQIGGQISLIPAQVGNNVGRLSIPAQMAAVPFDDKFALKVISAFWPLMRKIYKFEDTKVHEYGKPEFTASTFQRGRAVYVSSLGYLDPEEWQQTDEERRPEQPSAGETSPRPVVYTVIVGYKSRWALGRLVERIHNLGILRLAAIRDIDEIESCGHEIRRIHHEIIARDEVAIEAVYDRFRKIGENLEYGLMNKVERSRYYYGLFQSTLKFLSIGRIEGFQPYDQFITRRMFSTFDYINRVGIRYGELRREIDLALTRRHSESLLALQKETHNVQQSIARAVTAMENTETRIEQISADISARTNDTVHLLKNAEFIIAAPLVYYIGRISAEWIDYIRIKYDSHIFSDRNQVNSVSFVFSFIAVIFIIYFLRRSKARRQLKDPKLPIR